MVALWLAAVFSCLQTNEHVKPRSACNIWHCVSSLCQLLKISWKGEQWEEYYSRARKITANCKSLFCSPPAFARSSKALAAKGGPVPSDWRQWGQWQPCIWWEGCLCREVLTSALQLHLAVSLLCSACLAVIVAPSGVLFALWLFPFPFLCSSVSKIKCFIHHLFSSRA